MTTILTLTLALALAACGDDRSVNADSQVLADGSNQTDGGVLDPDQGSPDQLVTADQQAPDLKLAQDAAAPVTLKGTVTVSGVACGATPADDCKGTLYVGVIDKPVAPPQSTLLGATVIAGADLSAGKVAFEIGKLPAGAGVYVSAMLSESGQLSSPPFPKPGDLVVQPQPALLSSATTTFDLQLDSRWK
jgi:hypothetical protein